MAKIDDTPIGTNWEILVELSHARDLLCNHLGIPARSSIDFERIPNAVQLCLSMVDGRSTEARNVGTTKSPIYEANGLPVHAVVLASIKRAKNAKFPSREIEYRTQDTGMRWIKVPYFVRILAVLLAAPRWYHERKNEKEEIEITLTPDAVRVIESIATDCFATCVQDHQGKVNYLFHHVPAKRRVPLFERLAEGLCSDEQFRRYVKHAAKKQMKQYRLPLSGKSADDYLLGTIYSVAHEAHECSVEYADNWHQQRDSWKGRWKVSWICALEKKTRREGSAPGGKSPRRSKSRRIS